MHVLSCPKCRGLVPERLDVCAHCGETIGSGLRRMARAGAALAEAVSPEPRPRSSTKP